MCPWLGILPIAFAPDPAIVLDESIDSDNGNKGDCRTGPCIKTDFRSSLPGARCQPFGWAEAPRLSRQCTC